MKHLRLYEAFNAKDIHEICKKYDIQNYTIRPDGKVDVNGDVSLSHERFERIPLNFGVVNGKFDCRYNKLTTLEGCPEVVNGHFLCENNRLTTLEGCPEIVHGGLLCAENRLTTLEGCPEIVHGSFWCENNKLTSLEHAPFEVNGHFAFSDNPLRNWKWAPEVISGDIHYDLNTELEPVFKKFLELNGDQEVVKYVFREQIYYNIWKRDGSLNIPRFRQMMQDSGLKIKLPDETP